MAPVLKQHAIFGASKYGQAISYSRHVASDVNGGSFTQSGKNKDEAGLKHLDIGQR